MSQNGEIEGKPRKAHRVDGEWRQHVFLPGGVPVCQAELEEQEVPAEEKMVACGSCIWAISALRSMARSMVQELELPSVSPSRALKALQGTKFTNHTVPEDVLAEWGRQRLWNALV